MIITIDGPAASGKGSTASVIAREKGFYHLDSGLLYRGAAYLALLITSNGTESELEAYPSMKLVALAAVSLLCTPNVFQPGGNFTDRSKRSEQCSMILSKLCTLILQLVYKFENNIPKLFYKNNDITRTLRHSEIEGVVSHFSKFPEVRAAIFNLQRRIASEHSLVIEGRDCGSVVYPDAEYKFFLTAHIVVRAERCMRDPKRNYTQYSQEERAFIQKRIEKSLLIRDLHDVTRKHAPLIVPDKAIIIDNSKLSLQVSCKLMLSYIR